MTRRRKPAAAPLAPAEQLRATMAEHGITQREVAVLTGVSLKTVESWLASPGSASCRAMHERHLMLFRAVLPEYLTSRERA